MKANYHIKLQNYNLKSKVYSLKSIVCCLKSIVCCLKSIVYSLLSIVYCCLIITSLAFSQEGKENFSYQQIDFTIARTDSDSTQIYNAKIKSKPDSVRYRAEFIEYNVKENVLRLIGNAEIIYQDMKLKADTVFYNSENKNVIAKGTPVMWDGEDKMVGDMLIYNIDSRKGTILSAYTKYENGFYKGDRLRKVGKKTLKVHGGKYTTCNMEEPHYYFRGERMKIYVKDKVIVKPVVMYIGEIPVAYIPFWIFPIKPERHSGFLMPIIGFEALFDEGAQRYFERLGYYWAINDYSDATLSADYGEKRGWKFHLESRYKLRYVLDGNFHARYERIPLGNGGLRKDWDFRLNHNQKLDETTNLRTNAHFISSKRILTDSDEIDDRLQNVIESSIYLNKRWNYASANLVFNERRDLLNEITTRTLPSFSLSFRQFSIFPFGDENNWWQDIRGSFRTNFKNYLEEQKGENDIEYKNFNHNLSISYNLNLPLINFNPSISYSESWKNTNSPHKTINMNFGSLSVNTKIYGIFNPNIGRLKSIRHTISPRINYNSLLPNYSYTAKGAILPLMNWNYELQKKTHNRKATFSLGNLFEAKIIQKQKREQDATSTNLKEKKIELFRMDFNTSYDFKADKTPFGDLSSSFRTKPIKNFSLNLKTTHDVYTWERLSLNFSVSYSLNGKIGELDSTFIALDKDNIKDEEIGIAGRTISEDTYFDRGEKDETRGIGQREWSISANYSYNQGKNKNRTVSSLNITAKIQPTKNWYVNYKAYYDIEEKRITRQSYSIKRNLHCWEASLSWQRYGGYWNYYLIFRIKDLPDFKVEHHEKSSNL